MDLTAFKASTEADEPPKALKGPALALWHAHKGNWHKAHEIVQDDNSEDAAWVHAHLHRVEGDHANAGYWYRRAGKAIADNPLSEEWDEAARDILTGLHWGDPGTASND